MSVVIVPTILTDNLTEFENKLAKVSSLVERVQIDVVDGVFADNKTLEPQDLVGVTMGGVKLDIHLMVDEPIEWLEQCKTIGADRVIGHIERMEDLILFVAEAQIKGFGVGLGVDIETDVEKLKSVIEDIDMVLLMSVKAGRGGQQFDERVLPKIEAIRAMRRDVIIMIDGGLGIKEIKKCLVAEWAQEIKEDRLNKDFLFMEFAVGSRLLKAEDVEKKLTQLKTLRE